MTCHKSPSRNCVAPASCRCFLGLEARGSSGWKPVPHTIRSLLQRSVRNAALGAAAVCLLVFAYAAPARADQIVVGGDDFPHARIVGIKDGQLQFRGADGRLHTAWVDEIDMILVDRGGLFNDFNQAERFMREGEPARAVTRYRRSSRVAEDFWPELIAIRSTLACDAAGQVDQALASFVRVVLGRWAGPTAAARIIPKRVPKSRTAKVSRAIEHIDKALGRRPTDAQRTLLNLVRYELLTPLGDSGAARAARRVATLPVPPEIRVERVYSIQLRALRATLKVGAVPEAMAALDRAILNAPEALLPECLLLKGRTLLVGANTKEQIIRASWLFLRVAIHFPSAARAPEALYDAALAVERIGRVDKAIELLEACVAHTLVVEATRQSATVALRRMRSGSR